MNIRGECRVDYSLQRHYVRAQMGYALWIGYAVGGFLTVTSVLSFLAEPRSTATKPLSTLILAAFCFGFPELVAFLSWRSVRTMVFEPWQYEVTDEHIRVRTPLSEATVRWELLAGHRSTARAWIIGRKSMTMRVLLPREAFSEADRAAIDSFLRQRYRS